jgi:hypothetical protein
MNHGVFQSHSVAPRGGFALVGAVGLGISALLAGGFGCVGNVGGAAGSGAGPAPQSGSDPSAGQPTAGTSGGAPGTANPNAQAPAPASVNAGVAPLRRLTSEQYRNTVRDLLGLTGDLAALALPGDDVIDDRFTSNGASVVKGIDFDRYADAAAGLAKQAVANLGGLVPCDPKAGDAACATRFIQSFGRRAYRRPLRPDEVARLEKVFAASQGFADGIELVVTALLQSPKFLYLVEPVPADAVGKVVPVDSYAMASRLSYFLLGSMPDDALLDAAEKGQLASAMQLSAQAQRLTADPRFRANVGSFHRQWLLLHQISGAEKDPKLFPGFTAEVRAALGEESRRFVEHVIAAEDGKIETLLSAPFSILGGPLYEYYGVARPAGGADWQRVDLDPTQRAGILTQGSLLASQAHADKTSFILRGKLIREAIFCTPIPPPPPNAANDEVMLPLTATAKERAAAHRNKPECASCHALFDPLGFAFEIYDAAGRYRKSEAGGQAIDATVDVTNTAKLDGPVANAIELAKKIAGADEVKDCIARQWLRFALGREDAPEDGASLTAAQQGFRSSGKIQDLVAALARSDSFRYQRVSP